MSVIFCSVYFKSFYCLSSLSLTEESDHMYSTDLL